MPDIPSFFNSVPKLAFAFAASLAIVSQKCVHVIDSADHNTPSHMATRHKEKTMENGFQDELLARSRDLSVFYACRMSFKH